MYSWGLENRKIGSNFFWHDEIAKGLGGLDMEAASKVSGARFSVLVGPLAKLERAIIQFFLDFHTSRGYKEVSVPYIVSRSTLEGTGMSSLIFLFFLNCIAIFFCHLLSAEYGIMFLLEIIGIICV